MVFTQDDSYLNPGPQSPLHHTEVDDTVNYSQLQREPSVPAGDLIFLSIMSPLSWVDDAGEQSFIHNPEDGPYTPVHSSTPLYNTGDSVSDGHRTSSERNSPYTRRSQSRSRSRSRSPPSPQRESRTSRNANRTPRPVQVSGQQGSTCAPSQDTASADGVTLQHILFSLEMAEAEQGNWSSQSQDPKLCFQDRCQAHTKYLESNQLVRYYTAVLQHLEASEKALELIRAPLPQ